MKLEWSSNVYVERLARNGNWNAKCLINFVLGSHHVWCDRVYDVHNLIYRLEGGI